MKTMRIFGKDNNAIFEDLPPIKVFVVTFEIQNQLVVDANSELGKELEEFDSKKPKIINETLLKMRCFKDLRADELQLVRIQKLGVTKTVY